METGYWTDVVRIKSDATPVDNITKFAWEENDFEIYKEWVEYTPQRQMDLAKGILNSTDYIISKAVEELFSIDSLTDLLRVLGNYRTTYRDVITQRIEARQVINSLRDETQELEPEQEE